MSTGGGVQTMRPSLALGCQMKIQRRKKVLSSKVLPGMEFEGPIGYFPPIGEVPIEALAIGVKEIVEEVRRRGVREEAFLELVKSQKVEELGK